MVAKILADLEILDLTVTDPPIEDVIGRVFSQGTTN
jgi:ABC-2 type transport system ATP-binding protein